MAGPQRWAGCTALVSLVHGNHLYVANAGDCRAVLCRSGEAVRHFVVHSTACKELLIGLSWMALDIEAGGSVRGDVSGCNACRCPCHMTTLQSWMSSGSGCWTLAGLCPANAACGALATSGSWSPGTVRSFLVPQW